MDPYRVQILHIADHDAVVRTVAHDLVLYFLPARYTSFQQQLLNMTVFKASTGYVHQSFRSVSDAPASTS